ncbi:MAG: hypothetical protein R3B68_15135 [Phycisphaerales bacterium]
MKRLLRTGRHVAVFLLLGAATTVGVAWGLAAWGPTRVMQHLSMTGDRQHRTEVLELEAPGVCRRLRETQHPLSRSLGPFGSYPWRVDPRSPRGYVARDLAPWGVVGSSTEAGRMADDARGWPMLAMWSAWRLTWTRQPGKLPAQAVVTVFNGIRINAKPGGPRRSVFRDDAAYKALPLMPIPTGFAANTAFYAAAWGIIAFGAIGLRRLHRSRRGRCPRCGYDLRGLPEPGCPECGRGRAAAAMPIDDAAVPTE